MAYENLNKVLGDSKSFWTGLIVTVVVAWLYVGPLTNQDMYNAFGWVFAVAFPVLVGSIVASQVYNKKKRKTCPVNASAGGVVGGVVGLATVSCAACPLIFLSWFGLGFGASGGIFGGPWVKALSLLVLLVALNWSTKK